VAKKGTGVEYEHHVVGVRMRVTGAGELQMALEGLDNVLNQTLVPFTLQATNRIEPTRLSNFQSQRIRLSLLTTEVDEHFLIRRIIIYAKPVATEYPG
jgi:hypothetical protein